MRVLRAIGSRMVRAWDWWSLQLVSVTRLHLAVTRAQEQALKRSLRHCGAGVSIRQPTVIEVPHNVSIGDGVSRGIRNPQNW